MTHTKGPWIVDKKTVYSLNEDGVNRFHLYVDAGFDDNHNRTTNEEIESNAKLISAAPYLLEALIWIQKNGSFAHPANIVAVATVAIAKARGQS